MRSVVIVGLAAVSMVFAQPIEQVNTNAVKRLEGEVYYIDVDPNKLEYFKNYDWRKDEHLFPSTFDDFLDAFTKRDVRINEGPHDHTSDWGKAIQGAISPYLGGNPSHPESYRDKRTEQAVQNALDKEWNDAMRQLVDVIDDASGDKVTKRSEIGTRNVRDDEFKAAMQRLKDVWDGVFGIRPWQGNDPWKGISRKRANLSARDVRDDHFKAAMQRLKDVWDGIFGIRPWQGNDPWKGISGKRSDLASRNVRDDEFKAATQRLKDVWDGVFGIRPWTGNNPWNGGSGKRSTVSTEKTHKV